MNIIDIIKGRRSTSVMTSEEPPRELIEQILEAGTWAPSHYKTEPWKFFVLSGQARHRLGEHMAEIVKQEQIQSGNSNEEALERERNKPLRAPVVIAVAVSPNDHPKVFEIEEVEAVACAVQNMMLTAHSLGLGTIWRTGAITYAEEMKSFFGLKNHEKLLGFIYVGYSAQEFKTGTRICYTDKTIWMED